MNINPKDSIRFSNVVSKKYIYYYKDRDEIIKDFLNTISKNNLKIKGPLFYAIHNSPTDEYIQAEFFMTILNNKVDKLEELVYYSYYDIENMISTFVYKDIEENTKKAYFSLKKYINKQKIKKTTPVFYILSGDETIRYVSIKIGVVDIEDNKSAFE